MPLTYWQRNRTYHEQVRRRYSKRLITINIAYATRSKGYPMRLLIVCFSLILSATTRQEAASNRPVQASLLPVPTRVAFISSQPAAELAQTRPRIAPPEPPSIVPEPPPGATPEPPIQKPPVGPTPVPPVATLPPPGQEPPHCPCVCHHHHQPPPTVYMAPVVVTQCEPIVYECRPRHHFRLRLFRCCW
jgi:hypothetical protein